jgi:hypothetical protein
MIVSPRALQEQNQKRNWKRRRKEKKKKKKRSQAEHVSHTIEEENTRYRQTTK